VIFAVLPSSPIASPFTVTPFKDLQSWIAHSWVAGKSIGTEGNPWGKHHGVYRKPWENAWKTNWMSLFGTNLGRTMANIMR